jgi:tetratricopeptide (TPR) repeat protein
MRLPIAGRLARLSFACLAAAAIAAAAPPAGAQTPAEIKAAKANAGEGLNAYNAGEFDRALGLFNQARAVYPSAQIIRMAGYSELALEHWDKALEALEAALDAKVGPLDKGDRKDVEENIAKALSHLGTLTVTSKVPGAKLSIDGKEPRALPMDKPLRLVEGTHKLVVSAPEHLDAVQDVKIEGGKPASVSLDPRPKPKPPPPPPPPPPKPERKEWIPQQKMVGLATAGGGVAFGAAALATMGSWLSWKSAASSHLDSHTKSWGKTCAASDRLCVADAQLVNRDADTANKLRNVSLGLGVTAGVLAATGVVFVVMTPKPPSDAAPPPASAPPPRSASMACGLSGPGLLCAGAF